MPTSPVQSGWWPAPETAPAANAQVPRAAWVACVHRRASRSQQVPLYPQGTLVPSTACSLILSRSPGKAWDKSEMLFKPLFPNAGKLTTSL